MCLLRRKDLFDGKRKRLFQSIRIGLLRRILTLFGCGKNFVVTARDLQLDVAPDAVKRSGNGSCLFHIVDTGTVELIFQVATKAGTFKGFGKDLTKELYYKTSS